jgi:polyisoprenoid-binding protein YceI
MTTVQPITPKPDGSNHELKGQLTLRGITKDIQFFASISDGPNFEAETVFSINRKDFDMKYDGKKDNLIRDNVVLKIKLKAAP